MIESYERNMTVKRHRLSVIIPCYNEEGTLEKCVQRVLNIADSGLSLEIVIVDDGSRDRSLEIARALAEANAEITVLSHARNQGKGAALRTGFANATGDFVAVQDADLEYNPYELKKLLVPLVNGDADVVLGSRFLSHGAHRVLYFWHSLGNGFLTFLSNMFSDLNLTDMETCYKVFRRDILQKIEIEEKGFGVEPELVAKMARMRLRIYEMGISYYGRTYAEGKKIRARDGLRALYCIFHYNAPTAPFPIQFIIYLIIGGFSAVINLLLFLLFMRYTRDVYASTSIAFILAAIANYLLCIALLFRHKARWNSPAELAVYMGITSLIGAVDVFMTRGFMLLGSAPWLAKSASSMCGLLFNFLGRKYVVFHEPSAGPWKPQTEPTESPFKKPSV